MGSYAICPLQSGQSAIQAQASTDYEIIASHPSLPTDLHEATKTAEGHNAMFCQQLMKYH